MDKLWVIHPFILFNVTSPIAFLIKFITHCNKKGRVFWSSGIEHNLEKICLFRRLATTTSATSFSSRIFIGFIRYQLYNSLAVIIFMHLHHLLRNARYIRVHIYDWKALLCRNQCHFPVSSPFCPADSWFLFIYSSNAWLKL